MMFVLGTGCLDHFVMSKNTDMNGVFLDTECLGNFVDDQMPAESVARIYDHWIFKR